MHKIDIVRAWKDPLYRATLSPEELAQLPAHPAGALELRDEQLKEAAGGLIVTTYRTCTEYSVNHLRTCCP